MCISVRSYYKSFLIVCFVFASALLFMYAKADLTNADFGKTFGSKALLAEKKLAGMEKEFTLCAKLCNSSKEFMQAIVFPEVMRYNSLKDGIEAESLRTLYVQFGEEYANFSIGLFQMKPTFAIQVEAKAASLLPGSLQKELQLGYTETSERNIRMERVQRLQDEDWQLVYLTAFVAICNTVYGNKSFNSPTERLQWYATLYNAGFDKPEAFIINKIKQDNFYLYRNMPGNKFKYAAIAAWSYNRQPIK